jgi:hypothetical protein
MMSDCANVSARQYPLGRLAATIALLFATSITQAAEPPCARPECTGGWEDRDIPVALGWTSPECGSLCNAVVKLKWRSCNDKCEIFIKVIEFDPVHCTCPRDMLGQRAIEAALFTMADVCGPSSGGCVTDTRVMIEACMSFITICVGGNCTLMLQPCNFGGDLDAIGAHSCCSADYKVCSGPQGKYIATITNNGVFGPPCPPLDVNGNECMSGCLLLPPVRQLQ